MHLEINVHFFPSEKTASGRQRCTLRGRFVPSFSATVRVNASKARGAAPGASTPAPATSVAEWTLGAPAAR